MIRTAGTLRRGGLKRTRNQISGSGFDPKRGSFREDGLSGVVGQKRVSLQSPCQSDMQKINAAHAEFLRVGGRQGFKLNALGESACGM
jgi:hypothetical protein